MKYAFYGLLVAGFVACQVFGIGRTLERVGGSWTAPPMVLGSLLGVAILGLAIAFVAGARPAMLGTERSYVVALAVLIAAKVIVSLASAASTALARG